MLNLALFLTRKCQIRSKSSRRLYTNNNIKRIFGTQSLAKFIPDLLAGPSKIGHCPKRLWPRIKSFLANLKIIFIGRLSNLMIKKVKIKMKNVAKCFGQFSFFWKWGERLQRVTMGVFEGNNWLQSEIKVSGLTSRFKIEKVSS